MRPSPRFHGLLRRVLPLLLLLPLALPARAGPPTGEVLRVAVNTQALRDASRIDLEVSLRVWTEELARLLEIPAQLHFYDGMAGILRDMESDRINFVISDGLSFVRHASPGQFVDGFGGLSQGDGHMVLITRPGAGIRHPRDLAGKRVLVQHDISLSSLWLETFCLKTFQKPCEKAGLMISREPRAQQQILKVFFDKTDAALVAGHAFATAAELNPQIRERLRVLEEIRLYPGVLGLFGARVSPAFREYVIARVPLIHDQPRGRQLMEVMQTERIGRIPQTLLDPLRQLQRDYDNLAARLGARGISP